MSDRAEFDAVLAGLRPDRDLRSAGDVVRDPDARTALCRARRTATHRTLYPVRSKGAALVVPQAALIQGSAPFSRHEAPPYAAATLTRPRRMCLLPP